MFTTQNKIIRNVLFVLFFISFAVLVILQLNNISLYPAEKGFDSSGHIQYVQIVKNEKRIPLASEGWETYHPPLYYVFASFLPTIKSVQYMNLFTWLFFSILVYFFIYKYFKNKILGLMGMLLTSSLPMFLYITPMISNEFFSSLMISLTIIYYLLYFKNKKEKSYKEDIILGILLGLSLLSKVTSLVLLAAMIIDTFIDNKWRVKRVLPIFGRLLIIVLLVSGWFYVRNIIFFGNPLVFNTDFPGNEINQVPGYRDLNFFTDPSGFLRLDIFNAHYYSLWAGIYYSWFYDGHNALIPVQSFSKIGSLLVIFSLQLFSLSVLGFVKGLKTIDKTNRLLFIYPFLLLLSFILFNFKYPFYSTVKAVYLISAVIPWIYFVILGAVNLSNKFKLLLVPLLIIYFFLIIKNFWILGWWFNFLK